MKVLTRNAPVFPPPGFKQIMFGYAPHINKQHATSGTSMNSLAENYPPGFVVHTHLHSI